MRKAKCRGQRRECQRGDPGQGPVAPSGAVVTMPNNRPTICTADGPNCVAITSRVHFDVGGYDYHPNTAATVPQRLDNGVNVRRARIGVVGKFLGDWNFALIYDFGGSSDGFGGTGSVGGTPVGFLPGGACRASRTPISATPASSRSAASSPSKAASWTSPTRWTKPRAPTTSCSWSAPPPHHRHQYRRRRLPLHRRRALVQRQVLGRRLCDGPDHGRHPFGLQHQPARHHRAIRRHRPRRGPDRQRQRLLAASRRRCRMADPAAAQSGHARANAHAQRSSRTAHRSDHADLDRRDRRCIGRAGL